VNVLDENITRDQADLLRGWGIRFRSISRDLANQGIGDDDIVPLLLRLKKPTLLTRDSDFFDRTLVHAAYALVWFDVERKTRS
jgi:predicted nuclease of predicted toxin-antitoxin system